MTFDNATLTARWHNAYRNYIRECEAHVETCERIRALARELQPRDPQLARRLFAIADGFQENEDESE